MKTRILCFAILLCMAESLTMTPFAQENIKAMIRKCETMDVIDASIVRNKRNANSTSGTTTSSNSTPTNAIEIKSIGTMSNATATVIGPNGTTTNATVRILPSNMPQSVVTLTLKYTPGLEKELVEAFRKDQEKAIYEVEQKKEGRISHMLYRFDGSEYSFTIKNDTITINEREGGTFFANNVRISMTQPLNNAQPLFQYNYNIDSKK